MKIKSMKLMTATVCIPILMAAYGVGQVLAATIAESSKNEPATASKGDISKEELLKIKAMY